MCEQAPAVSFFFICTVSKSKSGVFFWGGGGVGFVCASSVVLSRSQRRGYNCCCKKWAVMCFVVARAWMQQAKGATETGGRQARCVRRKARLRVACSRHRRPWLAGWLHLSQPLTVRYCRPSSSLVSSFFRRTIISLQTYTNLLTTLVPITTLMAPNSFLFLSFHWNQKQVCTRHAKKALPEIS